jgi:hypothetical protein
MQVRYTAFLQDAKQAVMDAANDNCECTDSLVTPNTVKVGALLPHEVTTAAMACYCDRTNMHPDTYERQHLEFDLQWHGLTQRLLTDVASENSSTPRRTWIPICDVSGSMSGQPMDVAIALSLLLAEVNSPESGFNGQIFTFHSDPELIDVFHSDPELSQSPNMPSTNTLRDIGDVAFRVSEMPWGGSTDILKTMKIFCERAVDYNTTSIEMAQQGIVIFSDMEFDQAIDGDWKLTHKQIVDIFSDAGFDDIPRIIFWNLRESRSVPVSKDTKGVSLLSGFSAQLLTSFLSGDLSEFTPIAQLRAVLDKPAYANLRIM